jgi:periplasmic divalent cation tolerance protein
MSVLLVLTTLPNRESAESMAQSLVEGRLAACVSILSPSRSIYRWQGTVEAADEVPLMIKTTEDRYPALEAAIQKQHPYEVPEIIALPVTGGLHDYLTWVDAETKDENWLQT